MIEGTMKRPATLRLIQKTPALVERVLEVSADAAQRFAVTFPIKVALEGEYTSFSGPEQGRTLFDTVRGSAWVETFPVAMVRAADRVGFFIAQTLAGLAAEGSSPDGEWARVTEDDARIKIVTAQIEAAVPKKNPKHWMTGIEKGSFLDRATGFREAGDGLMVID